ncbi:MAG: DUF2490 domain-containing protein [Flavobacteriales bacterium]|nr:DUF2490 domain-containing protein [Flavobacteriales bacterium]
MKKIHFIIILIAISSHSWSQDIKTTRDIGVWLGGKIEYKLNKKWSSSFTQEFRTFDNAIKTKKILSDFELFHQINKTFRFTSGFRYAYTRNKDFTFSHNIRRNIDFSINKKLLNTIQFRYRFRYQISNKNLFTGFNEIERNSNFRNAITIQHKFKKHSLYITTELFRQYSSYSRAYFNKLRFSLGDKLKLSHGKINLSLIAEHDLNQDFPLTILIAKFNYTINIKNE